MRLVRHAVVAGLVALVVGSAAPQARGASTAITLERATASSQGIAQISCPDGTKKGEYPGLSSSAGKTLFHDEDHPATMDGTKAKCADATSASAKGNSKLYASASDRRLRSKATLSSEITPTGDAAKDRFLDGQGIANLSYDVTVEVAATYKIEATLSVSRGDNTSSRGGISFDAGDFSTDLSAGGTAPEMVTLSKSGTLEAGDELSLDVFAIAASEPAGLTSSEASWKVELTITPAGAGVDPPAPTGNVTGTVRFEKPTTTSRGLDYARFTQEPAVGVKVDAVDENGSVLRTTTTDTLGRYGMNVPNSPDVRIRVSAIMGDYQVRKLGDSSDVYTIESAPFAVSGSGPFVTDILAEDDFDNGPLNLLFIARKCEELVRTAEPGAPIPPLRFRWHPDSQGQTAYAPADAGSPDEIFVAGQRATDSDVFDDACVAHEVGHFYMNQFGRSDSPGGPHGAKQSLDPRLAWSEGWATFFGCAATGSSVFRNTAENGTLRPTRVFDIEQNRVARAQFGPTGEMSVASTLWDLFDTRADAGDRLALGFTPLWDALRDTRGERFVYLGDFFDVLHRADPSLGPALRAILKTHGVRCKPGTAPDFASPFPAPIASGKVVSDLANSILPPPASGSHSLSTSSLFYEFVVASPGTVSIELQWTGSGGAPDDLDLRLYDADGKALQSSESRDPAGVTESIVRGEGNLLPAGRYVVEVTSSQETANRVYVYNRGRFRLKVTY